jgi:inosose dehydratase
MQSRRAFLQTTVGAAAGLASLRAADAKTNALVGTQLYGWGQYYERENKNVYHHLDEVFSAIRDMGYDYAEGSLDFFRPERNGEFADKLKAKGLKPVAIYSGGQLHNDAWEKTVEDIAKAAKVCAQAGYQVINCNPDPIGRAKTEAELKTQARALDQLGRELKKLDLKLAVHNHTPEMENKGREFRHNFTATNPDYAGFCYDVHWVFRGGVKPEEALKEFGSRIASWHLRQSREGIWWEDLAIGDVDYAWIARYAFEHELPPIYTVELALEKGTKITRSVVENHRRSREFVKSIFIA